MTDSTPCQTSKRGTSIGIIETSSIAKGFQIADSVLKAANVEMVVNRTICPGKYMVLISGDVDAELHVERPQIVGEGPPETVGMGDVIATSRRISNFSFFSSIRDRLCPINVGERAIRVAPIVSRSSTISFRASSSALQ